MVSIDKKNLNELLAQKKTKVIVKPVDNNECTSIPHLSVYLIFQVGTRNNDNFYLNQCLYITIRLEMTFLSYLTKLVPNHSSIVGTLQKI